MNLSRLEALIGGSIVLGVLWLVFSATGGHKKPVACEPVMLGEDVKAYIDTRAGAEEAKQSGALPGLLNKVSELERKLAVVENAYMTCQNSRAQNTTLPGMGRTISSTELSQVRATEIDKIKGELGSMCPSPAAAPSHSGLKPSRPLMNSNPFKSGKNAPRQ